MDSTLEKQLKSNFRKEVFEVLELISSKEEQLDYQKKVPIAYVSAELFDQWNSCYQIPNGQAWYRKAFSLDELLILQEFDNSIESIASKTSVNPPIIEEFIKTSEWVELSISATKALISINNI